ncbi:Asp23/Gls24 family envelope stress response protein [Streptomyces sp. NPDC054864]
MTDTGTISTNASTGRSATPTPAPARGSTDTDSRGTTTIADSVVATIAGIAIRGTDGVHSVGKGASKAFGTVAGKMPGTSNAGRSVRVDVTDKQVVIDVDIEVEYGMPIHELADQIRTHVTDAVETMTDLSMSEINLNVFAVHVVEDDDEEE